MKYTEGIEDYSADLKKLNEFKESLKYHKLTINKFLTLYKYDEIYSLICHRNKGNMGFFYRVLKAERELRLLLKKRPSKKNGKK